MLKNKKRLKKNFTQSSIEYNIGNALGARYMLSAEKGHAWFITPELAKGDLFDAKQAYLRAFKLINLEKLDEFSVKVLTNLAGNLNHSGRIVEALQLFDLVLKHDSNFPQALIGKADTLSFMISRSQCARTIALFAEIYSLFKKGLDQNISMPEDIAESVNVNLHHCTLKLKVLNFDFSSLEDELEISKQEYHEHTEELKFYLDNFLSLSEHALYCKCKETKNDDLMLGYIVSGELEITRLDNNGMIIWQNS